jgi:hypothetical protein
MVGLFAALIVCGAFVAGLLRCLRVDLAVVAVMPVFLFLKGKVTQIFARLDPPDST